VWFAKKQGVVGVYHEDCGMVDSIFLGDGETIHNSFSTTTDGRAAVAVFIGRGR